MTDRPKTQEPDTQRPDDAATIPEGRPEQHRTEKQNTPATDNQLAQQLYSTLRETAAIASDSLSRAGLLPTYEGLSDFFGGSGAERKATNASDTVLKKELGLPSDATEKQINEKISGHNNESLRQALRLPGNASERDVYNKMAADQQAALGKALGNTDLIKPVAATGPALRKELGLPAEATEKQVDERIAEHNQEALRKGLGMPPNATERQVYEKLAGQERYHKDVSWHKENNPFHNPSDPYSDRTDEAQLWASKRQQMTPEQRTVDLDKTSKELEAERKRLGRGK